MSISTPASKARSITRLTYPISLRKTQETALRPFQRRHYADEPATQSEFEADGATEAQHGDNSIAASADAHTDAHTSPPDEEAKQSSTSSATENATEQASSTADSLKSAAQTTGEAITGAAQTLGAAAGFGSQTSETSMDVPDRSTTVYVGNLFFDVRNEDLKKEFERAGPVVDAKVVMDARGLSKGFVAFSPIFFHPYVLRYECLRSLMAVADTVSNRCRFGYVYFETVEAAERAIELYNLQNFEGRRISVQFSLNNNFLNPNNNRILRYANPDDRVRNAPSKTLFIGNMSFDMSDRDLNNLFREVKNVIDVRVAIDRRTGQPRGFAHADFTDVSSAERALKELSGKVVCGRPLRLDFSTSTGRASLRGGESGQ